MSAPISLDIQRLETTLFRLTSLLQALEPTDSKGRTLLHNFIERDSDLEYLKCLVKYVADVNSKDNNGNTALHLALRNLGESYDKDKFEFIKVLLENGADVNLANKDGFTPLHYFFNGKWGEKHLLFFLEKGASMDLIYDRKARFSHRVFMLHWYYEDSTFQAVLNNCTYIDCGDNDGATILMYACRMKNATEQTINSIIERGASINSTDMGGRTALHYLCQNQEPKKEIAETLINKGANINSVDRDGNTPLHLALRNPELNKDLILTLIEKGADLYIKSTSGTPEEMLNNLNIGIKNI